MADLPNDMFVFKIGSCWPDARRARKFFDHVMDNPNDLWETCWGLD